MKAYSYSQLQLKMQVKALSTLSIYVDGHPQHMALDTLPFQLCMTVLCHQCKLALLWPQPLTHNIPNLLSKCVILSCHCLLITHPIRFTLVSSSRLSQPLSEEDHCYGQRCAAYV